MFLPLLKKAAQRDSSAKGNGMYLFFHVMLNVGYHHWENTQWSEYIRMVSCSISLQL